MLKQLVELVTSLLSLARDTRENKKALAQFQHEMRELTILVEKLSAEVRHISDREKLEREKLALQLENVLLRSGRLLPPPPDSKKRK